MATQIITDQTKIQDFFQSAVPTLSNFLVGLVELLADQGYANGELGGSGSLVRIDDVCGILTARHVITHLAKQKFVGLILPNVGVGKLHNVSFKIDDCRRIEIGNDDTDEQSGPDLALLVPPPNIVSELQGRQSFYSLTKGRERALKGPPPVDHGIWVLSGFAGEWTEEKAPARGFYRTKGFRGQHGVGIVKDEREKGDFDYQTFEALYDSHYEGPDSYGGYSGGGLWQVLAKPVGTEVIVSDVILSGVAFYQSPKLTKNGRITREIHCHGRRSIFESLVQKVRSSPG
jgi:hypothetical protein